MIQKKGNREEQKLRAEITELSVYDPERRILEKRLAKNIEKQMNNNKQLNRFKR